MTHLCVSKLTNIGPDSGLLPGRPQNIIWTNVGMVLIGPLGTNFGEIVIEIYTFSFKKMHLKLSSETWQPFCLGLNVFELKSTTVEEASSSSTAPNTARKISCWAWNKTADYPK